MTYRIKSEATVSWRAGDDEVTNAARFTIGASDQGFYAALTSVNLFFPQ